MIDGILSFVTSSDSIAPDEAWALTREELEDFLRINNIDVRRLELRDPFIAVALMEFLRGEPIALPDRMTEHEQRNLRSFAFNFH